MKSLSLEKNHHLLLEILGISANGANQEILQRVLKSCVSTVKQHNLFNLLKTHHKLLDNLCLKAKKSNAMVTNANPAHNDGGNHQHSHIPFGQIFCLQASGKWSACWTKAIIFFKVAVPVLCARACRGSGEGSHSWGVLCYEFHLQAGTITDVSTKMF